MLIVDIISFFSLILIALLGVPLGVLIGFLTKDEVHDLSGLFPVLQNILFVLFFAVVFIFIPFYISIILFFLAVLFLYISWKRLKYSFSEILIFSVFSVILSVYDISLFLSVVILFLFSFLTGILFFVLHTSYKKNKFRDVRHHKHSLKHLLIFEIVKLSVRNYWVILLMAILTYLSGILFSRFF